MKNGRESIRRCFVYRANSNICKVYQVIGEARRLLPMWRMSRILIDDEPRIRNGSRKYLLFAARADSVVRAPHDQGGDSYST